MAGNDLVIIRQCLQSGDPIPDKIANAPAPRDDLKLYWNAFFDLDTTRSHSNGPVAISILSMFEYCEYYGLDEYQRETLIFLVKAMDAAHIKRITREMNSKSKR